MLEIALGLRSGPSRLCAGRELSSCVRGDHGHPSWRHLRYKASFKADLPTPGSLSDTNLLTAQASDVVSELTRWGQGDRGVRSSEDTAVTPNFPGKFKCVPFVTDAWTFPCACAPLERQGYHRPYMMEMW